MSNKEMALKVLYSFVFAAFCMDAFLNENILRAILGGLGLGAILRDLFVALDN